MQRSGPALFAMLRDMRRFGLAGYTLMPLRPNRLPYTGWVEADYSAFNDRDHVAGGGAVGIRLTARDLVVDVDPRNGGHTSFAKLCADIGIEIDHGTTRTFSGGGGMHLFFRAPEHLHLRGKLDQYPGIDFKHGPGHYVVAAGSTHDKTGQLYRFDEASPSPRSVRMAPRALLALLERPAPSERQGDGGEITNDELARLLGALDAKAYGAGRYDDWIRLSAAAHDATDGHGMDVWIEWCATDPDYAQIDPDEIARKWDSFESGRAGGSTYLTLFKAVSDAGRPDLLRQLGTHLDFDDLEPEALDFTTKPDDPWETTDD